VDSCYQLIDASHHPKSSKVPLVLGEIGESVLYVMIKDYCEKHKLKDWYFTRSLIIKDRDNLRSDFFTEIDFVLTTPARIVLFECKSYSGNKTLVGKGSINRVKKKGFNVFSQHLNHALYFSKLFDGLALKGKKGLQLYRYPIFSFSKDPVEDLRKNEWKTIMPLLEPSTLFSFLDKLRLSGTVLWNTPDVIEVVKALEDISERNNFHDKHIAFLTRIGRIR
jgi:hypothetical protein